MHTLTVELAERSYPIYIGTGLLGRDDLLLPHIRGQQVLIVSNDVVAPLYLDRLKAMLPGKHCDVIVLPDGEHTKNLETLNLIFDQLLLHRHERGTTLIALGGGVTGDMAGFAAAIYQRGVDFIQIPTTLLSQVDSSVGGKTGVNHALGKNMIGAFYQPQAVIADLNTLKTLPPEELAAGLAEVIKHGAIADYDFLTWIESNQAALNACDPAAMEFAVKRSCEIKSEVVAQDEKEGGIRAILNFGHTFGHAIEAGMGYGEWLHGQAVGCGMVMAADLSVRLGLLKQDEALRLKKIIEALHLPTVPPTLGISRYMELMSVDKKAEGGEVRYILLNGLGRSKIQAVEDQLVIETLKAMNVGQ